nr:MULTISPECIES: GntR family transcriptional regulator [Microbacterium]
MSVTGSDATTSSAIYEQSRGLIASGYLGNGERLPTVRQTAADLGVSPGTAARAFKQLGSSWTGGTNPAEPGRLPPPSMDAERVTKKVMGERTNPHQTRRCHLRPDISTIIGCAREPAGVCEEAASTAPNGPRSTVLCVLPRTRRCLGAVVDQMQPPTERRIAIVACCGPFS